MIKIQFTEQPKGEVLHRRIDVCGHAEGDDHSAICAAASMLIQALAIFLAKRYPRTMDASFQDGVSFVEAEADMGDAAFMAVFQMAEEGFRMLRERHPDQVDVK